VLCAGDRVRVTAQLLRARPEQHLWAESFERPYADILALQGEIAQAVARSVKARLTPEESDRLGRRQPVNPEALEAYLRGKYFFFGYTRERFDKAIESFQAAIDKDPGFAPAWSGLARAVGGLAYWGHARPSEVIPRAKAAAQKAVELDELDADGHHVLAALAGFADWQWDAWQRGLSRAIALNPSNAEAHFNYALMLVSLRRPEEALVELRIARDNRPVSAHVGQPGGLVLRHVRSTRESRRAVPVFGSDGA
jgi:tetratricopeptide (TPR) repeat protein